VFVIVTGRYMLYLVLVYSVVVIFLSRSLVTRTHTINSSSLMARAHTINYEGVGCSVFEPWPLHIRCNISMNWAKFTRHIILLWLIIILIKPFILTPNIVTYHEPMEDGLQFRIMTLSAHVNPSNFPINPYQFMWVYNWTEVFH